MNIKDFAKKCSSMDDPIGDVARDILDDRNFPTGKSEEEIKSYLDHVARDSAADEAIKEFLIEYDKTKR